MSRANALILQPKRAGCLNVAMTNHASVMSPFLRHSDVGAEKSGRRSDAAAYELTHDYDVAESGRYLESGHEPFQ
jgi:hypothetical protein